MPKWVIRIDKYAFCYNCDMYLQNKQATKALPVVVE